MKKRILLVEDEPTIQRLLHFLLSRQFDIHLATNGYEAFLWLENNRIPDLIIMDWMMPLMDGKTLLKCLKVSGMFSDIPVIILSASDGVTDEIDRLSYTVNKCLHKPFDPIMLRETIENIFDESSYGLIE